MKNRKKLVITLIGVIVLGIGLFVYQTFIKKQLHFKETVKSSNPLNTGFCVSTTWIVVVYSLFLYGRNIHVFHQLLIGLLKKYKNI